MSPVEIAFFVFVFLCGLAAGSFANVCILRIPVDMSIILPGSRCFSCGTPLLWRDNIPVLSYLLLRGKCRSCGASISIRYPIVELITCAAFVGLFLRFGVSLPTLVYCFLALDLVIVSGIDWDHLWIPWELSVPGIAIGPLLASCIWYFGWPGDWVVQHPLDAVIGGLIGGGSIWLVRIVGNWYFKKEAMGMGDVDLMAFLGTFLGWQQTLMAIFLGSLVGSVFGLGARLFGYDVKRLPFGPYLALGAYICILCGDTILYWYLGGPFLE